MTQQHIKQLDEGILNVEVLIIEVKCGRDVGVCYLWIGYSTFSVDSSSSKVCDGMLFLVTPVRLLELLT